MLKAVAYGPMASLKSAAEESMAVPAPIACSSRSQSGKKETKKRRVLTLEEKCKVVKATKDGEKHTAAKHVLTFLCLSLLSLHI